MLRYLLEGPASLARLTGGVEGGLALLKKPNIALACLATAASFRSFTLCAPKKTYAGGDDSYYASLVSKDLDILRRGCGQPLYTALLETSTVERKNEMTTHSFSIVNCYSTILLTTIRKIRPATAATQPAES